MPSSLRLADSKSISLVTHRRPAHTAGLRLADSKSISLVTHRRPGHTAGLVT